METQTLLYIATSALVIIALVAILIKATLSVLIHNQCVIISLMKREQGIDDPFPEGLPHNLAKRSLYESIPTP